ncbi:MAG: glycosyltransferase family 9 protein [Bacteroidetes bacterium]|nr:glycosyltransferase family 9 protein [Bacteroidota bacterium]
MTAKKWLDRGVYLSSKLISSIINRGKDPKSLNFKNILCIKEDEIGDFIYTLPVYSVLRMQFPNAKITVLCRPFGVHLLSHCPDIDSALSDYKLLENQYDLLIDLRGTVVSTQLAFQKANLSPRPRTQRIKNRKLGVHPQKWRPIGRLFNL